MTELEELVDRAISAAYRTAAETDNDISYAVVAVRNATHVAEAAVTIRRSGHPSGRRTIERVAVVWDRATHDANQARSARLQLRTSGPVEDSPEWSTR